MKKTVRVNISGFIFNIDEDAYNQLRHYLDDINHRFQNTEEGKEVISDVESRIAELFQERTKDGREVINSEDVNYVISILGRPEDFAGVEEEATQAEPAYREPRTRRLYRDTENRVVGGVCSGLGYYFGIDPIVFRIIFIATFFGWGTGFLIYIIFWIAVPSARTTAQKLEMKGEPITLGTIEKSIKDEFQGVKSSFERMSNGKTGERIRTGSQYAANAVSTTADVFLRFAVIFIGAVLVIIGISVLIGLITATFVSNTVHFDHINTSLATMLNVVVEPQLANWLIVCCILLIVIPVIFVIYLGLKLIFRFTFSNRIIGLSALGLWFITLGATIIFGVKIGKEFAESTTISSVKPLNDFKGDTLYISSYIPEQAKSLIDENEEEWRHGDDFFIDNPNGSLLLYKSPRVSIEKSESGKFEIVQTITARGRDRVTARNFANSVKYDWAQKDSLINFSRLFVMNGQEKFRAQNVKIKIRVPIGKIIYLSKSSRHVIYDIENVEDIYDGDMIEQKWIMREYGLSLFKNNSEEKVTPDDPNKDEVTKLKEELKELKEKKK
jgi:phage shock protein PspC (stress-responsive transcriptional regulator)